MVPVSKRSALYHAHLSLSAKMTEFGGWEMPLAYPAGTVREHLAVRHDAGVFDVSHLGTVVVTGPDAFDRLQGALTNDLSRIQPGRAQYTHLLSQDGSVLDDLIVWWLARDTFHVMPNAANTENVLAALGGEDITATRSVLALQGPRAREYARTVLGLAELPAKNRLATVSLLGVEAVVSGTGYTGSDGVEFAVSNEVASEVFLALLEGGVTPCGLAARDTLRLEAGLPLHGHELGKGLTPLNANLGWVVKFDKGDFPGRQALLAQQARGVDPVLIGLTTGTRAPLRDHDTVVDSSGDEVGWVSSGGFSPLLERGIGLAFVRAGYDGELQVRRGERLLPVERHRYPFVDL